MEEGAVFLGSNQCCDINNDNFVLSGGAIGVGAGVAATIGRVRLVRDSRLILEEGASLTLAAQSPEWWSSGTLSIVGPTHLEREIRFGNSASGLTTAQLRMIRYNGERVMLDNSGYLKIGRPGLVLICK